MKETLMLQRAAVECLEISRVRPPRGQIQRLGLGIAKLLPMTETFKSGKRCERKDCSWLVALLPQQTFQTYLSSME